MHSLVAANKEAYEVALDKLRKSKQRVAQKWRSSKGEIAELNERLACSIPLASPSETNKQPAATSSLSLIQKHEEVAKALLLQKNENRRLTNYLNQILREMEQKV